MFVRLEGDVAILAQKGVFKTADLYEWNGRLFAAHGGGYVQIMESGGTSKDGVNVINLVSDRALFRDQFGRLAVAAGPGTTALKIEPGDKLRLIPAS